MFDLFYYRPERSQTPTFAGSGAPILAGDDHDEVCCDFFMLNNVFV